jgi:5,10-methylenetetrahydrofolate reductase
MFKRPDEFLRIIEIAPPKESRFSPSFFETIASLQQEADYFSVPSNPLGNIHMANEEVCREITMFSKRPTILHLPTKGRDLLQHQSRLLDLHRMGMRNLFVVMGDPSKIPTDNPFLQQPVVDSVDLVRLIKEKFNRGLNCLEESIAEPTDFSIGCAVNLTPSLLAREGSEPEPKFQMDRLNLKIQAGADYLITQPIFDAEKAVAFLRGFEHHYGPIPIPIFPGIAPIGSIKQLQAFSRVPGITIPPSIMQKLGKLDPVSFSQESLKIANETMQRLKSAHPRIRGIYLVSSFSSPALIKNMSINRF